MLELAKVKKNNVMFIPDVDYPEFCFYPVLDDFNDCLPGKMFICIWRRANNFTDSAKALNRNK